MSIHLVDTAGLRDSGDEIERIGIERTWRAVENAGAALVIGEGEEAPGEEERRHLEKLPRGMRVARIINKIDLTGAAPGLDARAGPPLVRVSAKTGAGIEALRAWLLDAAGWQPHGEGIFMARERHLIALREARGHLERAGKSMQAFELMAEELRLAQNALARITGEITADDLLGEIFSRFCVGK